MAARKPLVIVNGQIQQLQSGDTLDATVLEVDVVSMQNDEAASINICQPVHVNATGGVELAQADASATVEVLGLVRDTEITAGSSGEIQTDGILSATTAQWDAQTGGTGGLTPGSVYYLDPDTPGKLTSTAPTDVGDFVVRVGRAVSTTEMEISIDQPILL